ncbi:MAG: hypothetical protein HY903_12705 [Deltaproteobacteria bacterium]|nr:hypothetical protein [Deltaproteobacteria bacterium]
MRCCISLVAMTSVAGCGVTQSDHKGPLVDLNPFDVPFTVRTAVVPAGGDGGGFWAIGADEPGFNDSAPFSSSLSLGFTVSHGVLEPGTTPAQLSIAVPTDNNRSQPYRINPVVSPHGGSFYNLGGVYEEVSSGQVPSLQRFRADANGGVAAQATEIFIHSATLTGGSPTSSPYDPAAYSSSANCGQPRGGQVPLAAAIVRDATGATSVDRMLAFLPHGRLADPTATAPNTDRNCTNTYRYYHRALALFTLDARGRLVDSCGSTCIASGTTASCQPRPTPTSPAACTPAESGYQRCNNDTIQMCDGTRWVDGTDCNSDRCSTAGTSAACGSSTTCAAGEKRCNGTILEVCDAPTSTWKSPGTDCATQGAELSANTPAGNVPIPTTEPAWLIDLPLEMWTDPAAAAPQMDAVVPSVNLPTGNNNINNGVIRIDPRLMDVNGLGHPAGNFGNDRLMMADTLFSPHVAPAPPRLLVDESHQRGYLFVNRWMPPADLAADSWRYPFQNDVGFALLAAFSLSPPAGRDVTVCSRGASFANPPDPFVGLDVSAAAAGLTYAKLAPTAAADPVLLTQNRFDDRDENNNSTSNNNQCQLFNTNDGDSFTSNGQVQCRTDLLPYKPLFLDAARELLLVTQSGADEILVFDGRDLGVAPKHVAVGKTPVSIAGDGVSRVYVANRGADSLSILDLDRLEVVGSVAVGRMPVSVFVDRGRAAGPLVYVLDLMGDDIAIYDPAAGSVRYAATCMRPAEMSVDAVNRTAVVHCKGAVGYPYESDFSSGAVEPSRSRAFKLLD